MACSPTVPERRERPVGRMIGWSSQEPGSQQLIVGLKVLSGLCGCSKTEGQHCQGGRRRRDCPQRWICVLEAVAGTKLDCRLTQRMVHMVLA